MNNLKDILLWRIQSKYLMAFLKIFATLLIVGVGFVCYWVLTIKFTIINMKPKPLYDVNIYFHSQHGEKCHFDAIQPGESVMCARTIFPTELRYVVIYSTNSDIPSPDILQVLNMNYGKDYFPGDYSPFPPLDHHITYVFGESEKDSLLYRTLTESSSNRLILYSHEGEYTVDKKFR
jgi:hypothetical protein